MAFYKMWYVYAIKSLKDRNLYVGISKDPDKRLKEHNSGMTISTKYRRPFEIIFKEKCNSRMETRERKKYYKSGFGREFLKTLK